MYNCRNLLNTNFFPLDLYFFFKDIWRETWIILLPLLSTKRGATLWPNITLLLDTSVNFENDDFCSPRSHYHRSPCPLCSAFWIWVTGPHSKRCNGDIYSHRISWVRVTQRWRQKAFNIKRSTNILWNSNCTSIFKLKGEISKEKKKSLSVAGHLGSAFWPHRDIHCGHTWEQPLSRPEEK